MLDMRRALQEGQTPAAAQTSAETNGTGAETPAEQEQALSTEAFLTQLVEAQGGMPEVPEGTDAQTQANTEAVHKLQTKAMMDENIDGIMEVSPKAPKRDVQDFILDAMQAKWVDAWDRAMKAARKIVEMEQNEKEQKDLRVEGANSGSQGSDDKPIRSRADARAAMQAELGG